jgi:hypothetical protein
MVLGSITLRMEETELRRGGRSKRGSDTEKRNKEIPAG